MSVDTHRRHASTVARLNEWRPLASQARAPSMRSSALECRDGSQAARRRAGAVGLRRRCGCLLFGRGVALYERAPHARRHGGPARREWRRPSRAGPPRRPVVRRLLRSASHDLLAHSARRWGADGPVRPRRLLTRKRALGGASGLLRRWPSRPPTSTHEHWHGHRDAERTGERARPRHAAAAGAWRGAGARAGAAGRSGDRNDGVRADDGRHAVRGDRGDRGVSRRFPRIDACAGDRRRLPARRDALGLGLGRRLLLLPLREVAHFFTSSTRRFFARPSGVVFSATGFAWPSPASSAARPRPCDRPATCAPRRRACRRASTPRTAPLSALPRPATPAFNPTGRNQPVGGSAWSPSSPMPTAEADRGSAPSAISGRVRIAASRPSRMGQA